MGEFTDTVNSHGTLTIIWGLAMGSYLFIAAATIKIAAGIILRKNQVAENNKNVSE
jgi:hypothetical protein